MWWTEYWALWDTKIYWMGFRDNWFELVCQISFEPYDRCRDKDSASAVAIAIASVSVDDSDSYIEGEIFILRRISSNCRRVLQGVYKLKLNAWIYYKP